MMYDVCIVGSGAGGAPIAYELSNAGFSVIVLEKGPYLKEEDFSKDEVGVGKRDAYTPRLEDESHVINERQADGSIVRYEGAKEQWSFWNGSMVGGSSNLMSGYFHRMKPDDFRLKSVYGKIKGTTVVDWPISYEDLEPYYDKVEKIIGVSGAGISYEPLAVNGVTKLFDESCKRLGYKSFVTPRAILSKDALGRKACSYSNYCGSYGCSTGAKGSARAALLQKCSAVVVPNAFVYRLESKGAKITKAHYFDEHKRSVAIEAKIFVLAAQAIESARLLLNSKSSYFKNGVANNSSQVGKNLIFSAGGVGEGRLRAQKLPAEFQDELMVDGLFFNRSLQDWYEFNDGGKRVKGGTIDFLFEHANVINRAQNQLRTKSGDLLWGDELFEKIYKTITTSKVLTFEVFNDWLPTKECFVSIDKKVKDKYGQSVAAINLYSHPHDIKVGEFLAQKAKKVLEDMGAEDITISISSAPPANLVAGGCRFGDDPKTSVLDKNCKAHEVQNLYITDASFMPTGGSVPYTWTIYANSFRIADHIKGIL